MSESGDAVPGQQQQLSDKENIPAEENAGEELKLESPDKNIASVPVETFNHHDVSSPDFRTDSPRRVRDIHLDGTTDNMPNVDPYMLDEQDLDINSEAGGQAGLYFLIELAGCAVSSLSCIPLYSQYNGEYVRSANYIFFKYVRD